MSIAGPTFFAPAYISPDADHRWVHAAGTGASVINSGTTFLFVVPGTSTQANARTGAALSGKQYCEFSNISRASSAAFQAFGLSISPISVASGFYNVGAYNMWSSGGGTGCGLGAASGYYDNGAKTTSAAYSFNILDIIGVAFDSATGKLWFSKNGTWISGDPATGASPTMTLGAGTYYFYASSYSCTSSSGTYAYDVYPTASVQTYAAPSGFSPYQLV